MIRTETNRSKKTNPLPLKTYDPDCLYERVRQSFLRILYTISPSFSRRSTGIFVEFGKFVWLERSAEGIALYNQGSFGKGTLSRSQPTWLDRNLHETVVSLEDLTLKRREQRRYKKSTSNTPLTEGMLSSKEVIEYTGGRDVEKFQLDLYEAYFLMFALNAISIVDAGSQKLMSTSECWEAFTKCSESFHIHYVVYHYYRSLGWIPKNGSKFGADFVLYQMGPEYRHADFAVVVVPIYDGLEEEHKSWDWLLRLNRICTQVKKTLVLCYVTVPADITDYRDLRKYSIREIIFKRWSPQKNREAPVALKA